MTDFVKFSNGQNKLVRPVQAHVLTSHLQKEAGSRVFSLLDRNELQMNLYVLQ